MRSLRPAATAASPGSAVTAGAERSTRREAPRPPGEDRLLGLAGADGPQERCCDAAGPGMMARRGLGQADERGGGGERGSRRREGRVQEPPPRATPLRAAASGLGAAVDEPSSRGGSRAWRAPSSSLMPWTLRRGPAPARGCAPRAREDDHARVAVVGGERGSGPPELMRTGAREEGVHGVRAVEGDGDQGPSRSTAEVGRGELAMPAGRYPRRGRGGTPDGASPARRSAAARSILVNARGG